MRRIFLPALAAACVLTIASPASAQTACPKLADVEWWTNTVSEVRRVVTNTYDGNWNSYIERWQLQRKDLQDAYDRGLPVEIKSRALVFRDAELKNYITMVDERISTLECLKKEYGDERPAKAVAPPPPPAQTREVVKAVEGQNLDLEVTASCQAGVASFQVTNLGERWPRLAEVSIYRVDTNARLSQRRVRMINSQQMIFKVPDEVARDVQEVGIFVDPTWYERTFAYDAVMKC